MFFIVSSEAFALTNEVLTQKCSKSTLTFFLFFLKICYCQHHILITCIRAFLIVSVVMQLMEASFGWLVVSLCCVECHRGSALRKWSFLLPVPVLGTNRIPFA